MCVRCNFTDLTDETPMERLWWKIDSSMEMEPVRNEMSREARTLGQPQLQCRWEVENITPDDDVDRCILTYPGGWTMTNVWRSWDTEF